MLVSLRGSYSDFQSGALSKDCSRGWSLFSAGSSKCLCLQNYRFSGNFGVWLKE